MVKDVGLFSAAMADVKPLDGRRRAARASLAKPLSVENGPPPAKIVRAPAVGPDLGIDDRSFDRDVARALSRGKRAPEATLDLHGMTLEAAERAVGQFL